jgi:hypothetical protein
MGFRKVVNLIHNFTQGVLRIHSEKKNNSFLFSAITLQVLSMLNYEQALHAEYYCITSDDRGIWQSM